MRATLYVGRWSPFHSGHKYIIDKALEEGKRVVIGIRDTPVTDSDPYTYEQRAEMFRRVYEDKVEVMKFPDIESINVGRNVGYDVNYMEVPPDVAAISATKVRAGESTELPPQVMAYLKELSATYWFTGLPCSGKTTLAKAFRDRLVAQGYEVVMVDGDDLRTGLCKGLGFSDDGRKENLRRAAHVCEMLNRSRKVVVACFVSPTEESREIVGEIVRNMRLVYVKCPEEVCEKRDVKGMWAKARKGEIPEFTGVSAPYEEPVKPWHVAETDKSGIDECVALLEMRMWGDSCL